MNEITDVESSTELYRLISKENLHLRSGHGRDDALIRHLAKKLDLDPHKSIPKQLRNKEISLEEFIEAFFLLTEPFAKMLNNIYTIMQRHNVRSALRSIRMKFSFQKICEELDFDLKHFREWLIAYRKLRGSFTTRLWTLNDINRLFQPIRTLVKVYGEHYDWGCEPYASPLPEPQIFYIDSRWSPLRELRDAMEQLRQIASEETGDDQSKALSALIKKHENEKNVECDPSEARRMLSDIWPRLFGLLSQLKLHSPQKTISREAIDAFQVIDQVLHEVRATRINGELIVRDLIELLRLPFWKYRWRVYEIWIMFQLIDCLDEYDVTLELVGDRLTLEEYKATKVAQFKDFKNIVFEVWAQLETSVLSPAKRRHIMPDFRICTPDASTPENTLLIIECKQRKRMKTEELKDLIEDYRTGAGKAILILFVNYDEFPNTPSIFSNIKLISKVSPANPKMVQEFIRAMKDTLAAYGIKPTALPFDAILFDVSGSMQGKYPISEISQACKDLRMRNLRSTVFFFASDLSPTEMLSAEDLSKKLEDMIGGSTNLDGALRKLHEIHPDIKRVAIVTDGKYDGPLTSGHLFETIEKLVIGRNFPSKARQ